MAVKPLQIHPAALQELSLAVAWYLGWSETTALNFVAAVDRAIGLVIESPGRWPKVEHSTRKFVLQRFPFAIVYREETTALQVLAIAHGHRRPGYWKERL